MSRVVSSARRSLSGSEIDKQYGDRNGPTDGCVGRQAETLLELMEAGHTVFAEGDDLAVEHHLVIGEGSTQRLQFGELRGDVITSARTNVNGPVMHRHNGSDAVPLGFVYPSLGIDRERSGRGQHGCQGERQPFSGRSVIHLATLADAANADLMVAGMPDPR